MPVLHLRLYPTGETSAELRFFVDKPNEYEERSLSLNTIAELIEQAEQEYYFPQESRLLRRRLSPENYASTGKMLYDWLDGSDRLLSRTMQQHPGESWILAIDASQKLAHLPWEVLHDGSNFLVARMPAVVPVRWVSDEGARHVVPLQPPEQPENRALQVLFMATSPLGVEPVLEFEAEEALILKATARQPLALVVEESGSLTELGCLIDDYGKEYFDVLHLTGHATITENGEPRFYTETETGELYLASAVDIAKSLKSRLPQLIFLSGCRTGQGGKLGAVPSLAEGLLKLGAKAVLGWGQTVLDTEATAAAAALYGELAAGYEVTEALSRTYQALIGQKARDWHLLRLYVGRTFPGQLVTPLRTRGRKPAPKPSVVEQFLDVDTKQVKVASRGSFVGRRRQLQSCLRALRGVAPLTPQSWGGQEVGQSLTSVSGGQEERQNLTPPRFGGQGGQCLGVLIHGMGGLGKSTLAARLCDRLPEFQRIVWVGRVDEGSLVKRLTEKLPKELRQLLQSFDDELKFRLRDVFAQLEEEAAQPFLLVLDDFEHNLEPRNDRYVLQPEAARVLEALLWAIGETYARHRVILTCRYDFESEWLQEFYKQPMDGLRGADEEKKCNRLSAFGVNSPVDEALQLQARRLADGNPRLLEWLDKVLLNLDPPQPPLKRGENSLASPFLRGTGGGSNGGEQNAVAEILARLEADPVELREKVLAKALLEQIDPTLEEILRRGLVYELPVPREALAAVCEEIPNLDEYINRAVALGLLEVSPDESLRVPHILPLKLLEDRKSLYSQGAKSLNQSWRVETEGYLSEEQCIEIHRLALLGKERVIALETSSALSVKWHQQSRTFEVVSICCTTLEIFEDDSVLNNLAHAEKKLGETDSAIKHYRRALEICSPDNQKKRAKIINNLAVIYVQIGQIENAISSLQHSLEISQDIGDPELQMMALHEMARICTLRGQLYEAICHYQQCLELSREIVEDIQGQVIGYQATTLHDLAHVYTIQEQFDKAIPLYQQSLNLKELIGDIGGQSMTLNDLAYIYTIQAQFDQAIPLYLQSLEIKERTGDLRGKATTLHNLAYICWVQGQKDEAADIYKQVLAINERTRDVEAYAITSLMMGQLLADSKGDFDTALDYLQQSLEIFQRIQSSRAKIVKQTIARLQQQTDDRG